MNDQDPALEVGSEHIDSSQYIRTYAKDFAKVTGKSPEMVTSARPEALQKKVAPPIQLSAMRPTKAAQPPRAPKPERVHKVKPAPATKPPRAHHNFSFFSSLFVRREPHINAMEETLPLGSRHDTSILTNQTEPSQTNEGPALMEGEPDNPMFLPPVAPLPPAPVGPYQVPPVMESPVANQPLPVALPALPVRTAWSAPPMQNIKSPSFTTFAPQLPTPPAVEMPLKVGTQPNFGTIPVAPPPVEPLSSPLHTFSSDFSDRIDTQGASQFSVLAAEKDARPIVIATPKKSRSWVALTAGILLIIVGLGAVATAYYVFSSRAPVSLSLTPPSLIATDQSVQLSGAGQSLMDALAAQSQIPLQANTVLLTYISEATTTNKGTLEIPESGSELFEALNLPAPDIFLRNISSESTVGIVHAGSETRPFFILRVTSYSRTFAGMLEWETTMPNDLAELYPPYPATPVVISSTTPQSGIIEPAAPAEFTDEVVDNHNTRVLKDAEGRSIMIYGYADPQTLIIARDENAFTLLLDRLQATGQ